MLAAANSLRGPVKETFAARWMTPSRARRRRADGVAGRSTDPATSAAPSTPAGRRWKVRTAWPCVHQQPGHGAAEQAAGAGDQDPHGLPGRPPASTARGPARTAGVRSILALWRMSVGQRRPPTASTAGRSWSCAGRRWAVGHAAPRQIRTSRVRRRATARQRRRGPGGGRRHGLDDGDGRLRAGRTDADDGGQPDVRPAFDRLLGAHRGQRRRAPSRRARAGPPPRAGRRRRSGRRRRCGASRACGRAVPLGQPEPVVARPSRAGR